MILIHWRLALALLPITTALWGCSKGIDQAKVIENLRQSDRQVAKMYEVCPEAEAELVRDPPGKGQLVPNPKNVLVVRAKLANGHELSLVRHTASDGTYAQPSGGPGVFRSSTGPGVVLASVEFDALLDAKGDPAVLEKFGIDFTMTPIDKEKVIDHIRKHDARVAKLFEVFPDSRAELKPAKEPFRRPRLAEFEARTTLKQKNGFPGFLLTLRRDANVGGDGVSVEFVGRDGSRSHHPTYSLFGTVGKGADSSSFALTEEEFDALVDAKGDLGVLNKPEITRHRPDD